MKTSPPLPPSLLPPLGLDPFHSYSGAVALPRDRLFLLKTSTLNHLIESTDDFFFNQRSPWQQETKGRVWTDRDEVLVHLASGQRSSDPEPHLAMGRISIRSLCERVSDSFRLSNRPFSLLR